MKVAIVAAVLFCVALVGGAVYLTTHTSKTAATRILPMSSQYTQRVSDEAWVTGATKPTVTLIEYADFQCPGCAAMAPIISQVMPKVSDFVQLRYRIYPLPQHSLARAAAAAGESAGRQGKFWEMHDILFANQTSWEAMTAGQFRSELDTYASSLNLNIDQFNQDLDDDSVFDPINKDITAANQIPLQATPTLVINGKVVQTLPTSADELTALLNAARPQ